MDDWSQPTNNVTDTKTIKGIKNKKIKVRKIPQLLL